MPLVMGDALLKWQKYGHFGKQRGGTYVALAAGVLAAGIAAKQMLPARASSVPVGAVANEAPDMLALGAPRSGGAAAAQKKAEEQAGGSKNLAVDAEFARTLFRFVKICIPGVLSKEFRMAVAVAALLVCRSYLDVWTSDNGGEVVKAIVGKNRQGFLRHAVRDLLCMMFPIALVNNLLKYSISRLKTMMRKRLSLHFHEMYLSSNTFYRISNLDKRMRNVDQLLTTDIDRFTSSMADLYSNLSKPILDILLFSYRLSKTLGMGGPILMIGYFMAMSGVLRSIQPPFGRLAADEQRLEGEYRLHHSRLIVHSEEIAFYRGGGREKMFINEAFSRVVRHLHKIFAHRLFIGIADSILIKYVATVVGYCIVSIPVFFADSISLSSLWPASWSWGPGAGIAHAAPKVKKEESASDIAGVYTRNSRLLISLAGAIGRLVLAAKEVTKLTGYCSRVADLQMVLDEVVEAERLANNSSTSPRTPAGLGARRASRRLIEPIDGSSSSSSLQPSDAEHPSDKEDEHQQMGRRAESIDDTYRSSSDDDRTPSRAASAEAAKARAKRHELRLKLAIKSKTKNVNRDLSWSEGLSSANSASTNELIMQRKVERAMVPGSLVIGGDHLVKFVDVHIVSPDRILLCRSLNMEIHRGTNVLITGPNGCGKSSTFRVLAGIWPLYYGTLIRPRSDRLFYVPQRPYLALGTLRDQIIYPLQWEQAQTKHLATDATMWRLLEEVHLLEVARRKGGLDVELDWSEVLSGGEKQRLAMARLFFHRPAFAVLDECTSAVSLDVEGFLYTRAKDLGISLITVSHRPSLWRFHEMLLKFDGQGGYEYRRIQPSDVPGLTFSVGEAETQSLSPDHSEEQIIQSAPV
ncbi:ABC transporter D family member 2 [Porphyridium purpureum]|uniref:Probable ATP-dependent transporter ycf16 n=1 Tax=Porphyridium purpureum TaxID=35688 RepID=A0A5J4Z191_PORPP|nr:ABC transporter D family member 2 [Porphyridium purpureum]|eukprot:POR0120..scf208_2